MTTHKKYLLLLAGLAVGATALAGAGYAHSERGGFAAHHGGFHERGRRMFQELDQNADGKVTQAEVKARSENRLATFDADKDGRLSLDEFQAMWLEFVRPRMVDRFQAFDEDGDAAITQAELTGRLSGMIERLDRNDDGAVTKQELRRTLRHFWRGHHGGRGQYEDRDKGRGGDN